MASTLTQEQIAGLAPDAQVAHAAQSLAHPGPWRNLGLHEGIAWGELQGSGRNPYLVAVDLGKTAFQCNCPSRKRPCKHALALLMLVTSRGASVPVGERPTWVAPSSSERAGAKEKAVSESPAELVGPSKRSAQREKRVQAGIAALALWLEDLTRQGLANAQGRPPAYWDEQAARLVDAQAPGLARRIRELSTIAHSGEGWPDRLLDQLGRLHLLLEAYTRLDHLAPEMREEVRTQIGWTQDQGALREQAGERDEWLVVGRRITEEDRLRVARTWLWGARSQVGAFTLEFAPPGRPLECSLIPGTRLDATLTFWPGPLRQRALVKARYSMAPMQTWCGYGSLEAALAAYSVCLAAVPWLDRCLMPLVDVVPVRQGNDWLVADVDRQAVPLALQPMDGWRLAALSGGRPLGLVGEWDGERLAPLSAWAADSLVPLTAIGEAEGSRR